MPQEFKATKYKLQSLYSKKIFDDKYWTLDAENEDKASLVRAVYEQKQLNIGPDSAGLYKYADWLPIIRTLKGSASPITYKSEKLAQQLGLSDLWVTFSGYNPKIGAHIRTCSFKETEAYSVCARMRPDEERILVVASAGNTARAFAQVCSDNNIPLLLCIPEDNLSAMYFDTPINPCVKLIVAKSGGDYFDAIHLSNIAIESEHFFAEGGAKNVARRDGMATTVLSAVTTIGRIPDFYFQSVGSGTGAIAAWEANLRFIEDGRFGNNIMRLMVSQNAPFLPMYMSWKKDSRQMLPIDEVEARREVEVIDAKVLSNRKPPYELVGGLYDALKSTNGDIYGVSNEELRSAAKLFEETEGVDIHPAAAVALASLKKSIQEGTVLPDDTVMLNITGGGEKLFKKDNKIYTIEPEIVFELNPDPKDVISKINKLFDLE